MLQLFAKLFRPWLQVKSFENRAKLFLLWLRIQKVYNSCKTS